MKDEADTRIEGILSLRAEQTKRDEDRERERREASEAMQRRLLTIRDQFSNALQTMKGLVMWLDERLRPGGLAVRLSDEPRKSPMLSSITIELFESRAPNPFVDGEVVATLDIEVDESGRCVVLSSLARTPQATFGVEPFDGKGFRDLLLDFAERNVKTL